MNRFGIAPESLAAISPFLRVAGAFGMEASGFWPRVNLKLISTRSESDRIDIQLKIYRGRGSRIPLIEGASGFMFTGVAANIAASESGAIPKRFGSKSVLQEDCRWTAPAQCVPGWVPERRATGAVKGITE